ncbi:MAG: ABC transporter substrate-binding protein [Candidatus Methanomethyliaceae archaeon]|nr:ABC transporter substrate-binding protein [Candidatus Methanomethyliaceae archaeon]
MRIRPVIVILALTTLIVSAGFFLTIANFPINTLPSSITIQDMSGRSVALSVPVNRAVILNSYWNEIASTLGVSDKIVGIDKYTISSIYIPKAVRERPVVGDLFGGVNLETILSLKPDVVIMDFGYGKSGDIIKSLESLGIPVICMYSNNFNDQINAIRLLGKIFGTEARAESLINFLEIRHSVLISTTSRIPANERPTVLLCRVEKDGLLTAYGNSTWGKIVEDVGGINIALRSFPSQSWPKINLETLLVWNPDIIIIVGYDDAALKSQLDLIMKSSVWGNLKAVKDSRVYTVLIGSRTEGAYLDWGPRMLIGEMKLAKMIQPKYFSDLNVDLVSDLLISTYYSK